MASTAYAKFLVAQAKKLHDWVGDDNRCILTSSTYVPDFTNNEYVSDLTGVLATGTASITSKTVVVNVLRAVYDGDDYTFTAASGGTANRVIIYNNTGVNSTSRLIAAIDLTATVLNGGDVVISWDNTATLKIFSIGP